MDQSAVDRLAYGRGCVGVGLFLEHKCRSDNFNAIAMDIGVMRLFLGHGADFIGARWGFSEKTVA